MELKHPVAKATFSLQDFKLYLMELKQGTNNVGHGQYPTLNCTLWN